jgi:F-type H+-transporting ATPase subunit a
MATGPHISLSAETLFNVAGFNVTNSIFTSLIVSTLIILVAIYAKSTIKQTSRPSGFQNVAEMIVEGLYNLVQSVANDHAKTKFFLPFIASFFIFVLFNNWVGILPGIGTIGIVEQESNSEQHALNTYQKTLIPLVSAKEETDTLDDSETAHKVASSIIEGEAMEIGSGDHAADDSHGSGPKFVPIFRPGTADLNTTLALALISVIMTQIIGVRYLEMGYFKKFINFSNPINFIVGLLEIISEFAKILSFAFRLFGNIFAGEVLLVVIAFIGGNFLFFAPIPFYGLEVFVGFIQALVFSMLSLVFFNMATIGHDDH